MLDCLLKFKKEVTMRRWLPKGKHTDRDLIFSFRCATLSCISPPAFSRSTDAFSSRSSPPKTSQHPPHHSPKVGVAGVKSNSKTPVTPVSNRGGVPTSPSTLKRFLSKWRCSSWGGWRWRRRPGWWRPQRVSVSGRRVFTSCWQRWTTTSLCRSNSTAGARWGGNCVWDRWVVLTCSEIIRG